jgi:hypothetical protein
MIARTLAAQGALVEPIHPDGLEILAPPHVQEALSLPEWSRVGFGAVLPEKAVRVSFESEWAQRLTRLLGDRGRYVTLHLRTSAPAPPVADLERELRRALVLENATFRLSDVTLAVTWYFLLVFHVISTSDEKREDIVHLCLNESNGTLADRSAALLLRKLRGESASIGAAPIQPELPLRLSQQRVQELAGRLLPAKVRAMLIPFLTGMERRMSRDLERLHAYYTGLRSEAAARIEDKKRRGEGAEAIRAEQSRLQVIEREYNAKAADLDRKYAMNVEIRLMQVARAQMPVARAEIILLRRKGVRKLHLDWNILAKEFEQLACESCYAAPKTYSICDDRLHCVCSLCMPSCPGCAKESCRACHPSRCPRCGHAWNEPLS